MGVLTGVTHDRWDPYKGAYLVKEIHYVYVVRLRAEMLLEDPVNGSLKAEGVIDSHQSNPFLHSQYAFRKWRMRGQKIIGGGDLYSYDGK